MIEMEHSGSLFYLPENEHEAAVVTTNGVIRGNGKAVCGKGQALEARNLFSGLETLLGTYLMAYGNRAFYLGTYGLGDKTISLVTFPTKHHYCNNSDLTLITQSAKQLKRIADKFGLSKVYLPAVGCGLGNLNYEKQVRPILQEILDDDRFIVVLGYEKF